MSEESKKNPLLALLVIINTFFMAFIFFKQMSITEVVDKITSKAPVTSSMKDELPYLPKAKAGSIIKKYSFGSFTANLARPSGPQRYITLDIVLYLETLSSSPLLEMENKKPDLRDEVIAILNTKTPKEVLKLEGRGILKSLLKNHLNGSLKSDQVKDILFVKFLVN